MKASSRVTRQEREVQNFSFNVAWSEEDGEYVALSSEFPGLSGLASEPEDAVRELRNAIEMAIEIMEADGATVPEARTLATHSGQFRVRVPTSVHAALARHAESESVSLNTFVATCLARAVGSADYASVLREMVAPLFEDLRRTAALIGKVSASPPSSAVTVSLPTESGTQLPPNVDVGLLASPVATRVTKASYRH